MLTETVVIDREISRVYEAFRDLDYWCKVLPDVLRVELLYDDGAHQEFLMTVERPNGAETIRGARFCAHGQQIDLFQPHPPPGFARMVGRWNFELHPNGGTLVTARRWFELAPSAIAGERAAAEQGAAARLSSYLRTNLTRFREGLEAAS
jgi:hypothetical protein